MTKMTLKKIYINVVLRNWEEYILRTSTGSDRKAFIDVT